MTTASKEKKKSLRDSLLEKLPPSKQQQILNGYLSNSSKRKTYIKLLLHRESPAAIPPVPRVPQPPLHAESPSPAHPAAVQDIPHAEARLNTEENSESRERKEDRKSVSSTCSTTITKQKSESLLRYSSCTNRGQNGTFEEDSAVRFGSAQTQSVAEPLAVCTLETVDIVIPAAALVLAPEQQQRDKKGHSCFMIRSAAEARVRQDDPGVRINLVTEPKGENQSQLTEEAMSVRDLLSSELGKPKKDAKDVKDSKLRRGKSLGALATKSKRTTVSPS